MCNMYDILSNRKSLVSSGKINSSRANRFNGQGNRYFRVAAVHIDLSEDRAVICCGHIGTRVERLVDTKIVAEKDCLENAQL